MSKIKKYLSRLPLTLKMVMLTLIVGVIIWALLDSFVNTSTTKIFEAQLSERLTMQATSYRYRFGRYVYAHSNLAKLFASRYDVITFLNKINQEHDNNPGIKDYSFPPSWFPGLSGLRSIAIPRYTILIDSDGRVREVYNSRGQAIPELLLSPPASLMRRSDGVSYLTEVQKVPYIVTTEQVFDPDKQRIGYIMLASPVDADFLLESQGRYTESIVIALVTGDDNRIIVSSDPEALPSGSLLDKKLGQHITIRQTFFEYGDSDMNFKFASMVSKDEVIALSAELVKSSRRFRAIIAIVFIASFALITFFITRRIVRVTNRISEFSSEITGERHEEDVKGDQMDALESRFNLLTREVLEARETIKKQAEEVTRLVVNQAYEAILTVDKQGIITSWNPRAEQVFGWTEDEVVGKQDIDIILPVGSVSSEIKNFIETGCDAVLNRSIEIETIHRNGVPFPAELSVSSAMADEKCFIIVMVRDISERKIAEKALMLSEDKFSKAFRSSPVLMAISTLEEGRFIDLNDTFLSVFGYDRNEIIGRTSLDIELWAEVSDREILISQLKKHGVSMNVETRMKISSGDTISVLLSAELITVEGEQCVLSVIIDLTDRYKLEAQLLQAQKMEAVGHLAGGIAHDFNNILTAIIGFGHILSLQEKIKEDKPLKEKVQKILVSADKGAALVKSLLAFSRKQVIRPSRVELNEIISRLESLLLRLVSEDVALQLNLAPGRLNIMADSGQLEQMLMNFVTNARDAMPLGGSIELRTGSLQIDDDFITGHGYGEQGPYVFVSVTDHGEGMDEDTKSKIFEPFFTTKETGKGTGLGLAIIFGIVKQHKGYINVYSEPGHGTTFQVLFPEVEAGVSSDSKGETEFVEKGAETILLAEDNQDIREMITETLRSSGYTVIETSDGMEAVGNYKKYHDQVQLLILDVIMPGKNGREVYDEISKIKPEIKALFMTGYSGTVLSDRGVAEEEFNVIYKPFTPHDILKKVRNVLDRQALKKNSGLIERNNG